MFVFNRSAIAVLLPLALLIAVVVCSNLGSSPTPQAAQKSPPASPTPTALVAQVDPSQKKGS
jgi:Flp pilus assembly protein CpaB